MCAPQIFVSQQLINMDDARALVYYLRELARAREPPMRCTAKNVENHRIVNGDGDGGEEIIKIKSQSDRLGGLLTSKSRSYIVRIVEHRNHCTRVYIFLQICYIKTR